MIKLLTIITLLIMWTENTLARGSKGGWLFTPAFVNVTTSTGVRSGLGCGVNLETFFYGNIIAGGLCCQTAYSKYLDVNGGYLKLMPRFGIGHVNDEYVGIMLGGSYGLFIANNGGDDNDALYDYSTGRLTREATNQNYMGMGWGIWLHLSINRDFALDISVDNGGNFTVTRFGLIFLKVVTINMANISGPGISGMYVYPGLTLRM